MTATGHPACFGHYLLSYVSALYQSLADMCVLQAVIIASGKRDAALAEGWYSAHLAATLASHSAWSWLITGEAVHRQVARAIETRRDFAEQGETPLLHRTMARNPLLASLSTPAPWDHVPRLPLALFRFTFCRPSLCLLFFPGAYINVWRSIDTDGDSE